MKPPAYSTEISDYTAQIRLFVEQKPQRSEDCRPVLHAYPNGSGLLAVFDGAGGAGGTSYATGADGESFTGAFLASRLGKKTLLDFFEEMRQESQPFTSEASPKQLEERFKRDFKTELAGLQTGAVSKIKSSLIRYLPTTMAAIYYETRNEAADAPPENGLSVRWQSVAEFFRAEKQSSSPSPPLRCNVLWAGDSRCYLLAESSGLQQLTEDDLKTKGDALANLTEDSPMSNFISADVDFVVNFRRFEVDLPVVLMAATDGCFNFVASPAHFEFILLKTLHSAESAEQWQADLTKEIEKITGDDATMSLIALGWRDFGEIKRSFHARLYEIGEKYISPLSRLDEEITWLETRLRTQTGERRSLREELWREYKQKYESYLIDGEQK